MELVSYISCYKLNEDPDHIPCSLQQYFNTAMFTTTTK